MPAPVRPPSGPETEETRARIRGELLVEFEYGLTSTTLPRLQALLDEALDLRPERLVLDLSPCDTLDAPGLALLVDTHRAAMRRGTRFVLRGCCGRIRKLFAVAGVQGVLQLEAAAA